MLWKLSLTGIKSRFKDYLVLFSGLTFASAIFYMFMSIATNTSSLKGSIQVAFSITRVVFGFGIALLAIITLVYIVYANSFLLSMRQKDYGMYMMLGARTSKIGSLIFLETLVVGFLATILGSVIGIGLTQLVSQLLISQLGLHLHKFVGFYLPALLWTLLFFAVLFFLAALWNRHKLIKSNVINLLRENQKPVKLRHNTAWKFIEAILGIGLLAVGYWAMADYKELMTNSIVIGFFTIVIGSYFVFDSFFTGVVNLLRKNNKFKYKKLHSFTLGQLKFRLTDYTRILSIVSLLFALALGAITVGLNFNNLTDQTLEATYYDVVLYKKNATVKKDLRNVSVRSTTSLNYRIVEDKKNKENPETLYVSENEINQGKLKYRHFYVDKNGQQNYSTRTFSSKKMQDENSSAGAEMRYQLASLTPYSGARVKIVSQDKYDQLKAKNQKVELLLVNNFRSNFDNIEKLQKAAVNQMIGNPETTGDSVNVYLTNSKTGSYRLISSMASGFEFMGFFLGLAFLAMLASTLMFKVLSGANSDKPRYNMLWKMGTRKSLLKSSIAKEIGVLFALPAVLGVIDVLFGLQFFKSLLKNPYDKIWIPFTIFGVLYVIYYILTVVLYQGIVLRKENN
ncbi:ABC transporter permease [Lactobacillus hominis]|uniref:ABC-type antimicrobial peptide transport system, permease component n=1 Tax=Lactobacillus hominis DSM 23910 = CRBIP 24.179 TaxID=1423758 RepID=I7LAR3_9LACO|nr:ABC transporter permease [Lactobacillus hominis]KRM85119.1 peptide ABC transporter permease [Lactobacillus hominis DSM 23910 = CRBIP 24.179]MCT3348279.1 ABC transporter permease [Lactobacillus hominis]CCI82479.1 ABC-type antimicrobial peptide transport system, permease component [Lactobacillus hominis DSM 23910 = CRBIP 24.179]